MAKTKDYFLVNMLQAEERCPSCSCWSCIELEVKVLGMQATLSGAVSLGFLTALPLVLSTG